MSQTHLEALRQIITSTPADDRLKEVRHALACWPEVEGKEAGLEAVKETLGAEPWASWLHEHHQTDAASVIEDTERYRPRYLLEAHHYRGHAPRDLRLAWCNDAGWDEATMDITSEDWTHGEFGPRWIGQAVITGPDQVRREIHFRADFRVFIQPDKVHCRVAEVEMATAELRQLQDEVEELVLELQQIFGEEAVELGWERLVGQDLGQRVLQAHHLDPRTRPVFILRERLASSLHDVLSEALDDNPQIHTEAHFGALKRFDEALTKALADD